MTSIKTEFTFLNKERHPFHMVDSSPWPFFVAWSAFLLASSMITYMQYYKYSLFSVHFSILLLMLYMSFWLLNMVQEATFGGYHTLKVKSGISMGMVLFIMSEVFFFFSFFWAFFHSSLNPVMNMGCTWPLKGIMLLNAKGIPLLNTVILLSSGIWLTYAHSALVFGDKDKTMEGLFGTVLLGMIFTMLQVFEYTSALFQMNSSMYGSLFYMCTGFHGFHVMMGTAFLAVGCIRVIWNHVTSKSHVGIETAAWYWHFVDVVWLFLYMCLYWWSS